MTQVRLRQIRKQYADGTEVIHGVDLDIHDGEFMVFVGPSGCGKSTLLRMIAGLEDISGGELHLDGMLANDIAPAKRGLAMVFQSYALYPHMSVFDNMAFSLKMAGQSKVSIESAVQKAAAILQIEHLLDRKPKDLSGGQRQRVAIGRAIVRQPKLFLFDEPLSNLDASLRVQMRIELSRLHQELQTTMIYVTHDQVEAMTLGQRIVVFNGGRIEQVGKPLELYEKPANLFVAGFLGAPKMNLLPVMVERVEGDVVVLKIASGDLIHIETSTLDSIPQVGRSYTLGCRAEHVSMLESQSNTGLNVVCQFVEHLGDSCIVYASLQDGMTVAMKSQQLHRVPKSGGHFTLSFDRKHVHLFDSVGARI
ncbi:sn-glycerol-3-phosphate ABC transporter ATP-binding protein UgpC [Undibacterium sp. LX40W]|uniref:Sn-glycerol-3-phosphate ABC transporter ATP-binding protein UgpC n=1 Tax=Undibacterium nitidum TaxID=2762298 RepID=A0A923HPX0_9BURK|nr:MULTISPECIES: sn-glycerol-3-phosphate ABC transporter ATP-binding protein UgpC [Undibacterium]MBC3883002.1 sn-glycerol-3-phosphate ABC transporter ATP-binding protein UgpC [Undibacterium nitidum]MBC3893283.1 sn-glycerol-3-phosphate ABC transporter ATP-binding protein UgpC [Undibacterium sp. LX40W]